MPRGAKAICAGLLALAVAGCSTTPSHTSSGVSAARAAGALASATPAALASSPPAGRGLIWRAAGTVVAGTPATYLATTDSGSVGLLWMNPRLLTFRFVPGTQYPEGGPVLPADRQGSTWVPRLAAAFNGAFKLHDNVGGYYYAGTTVRPLRPGYASLVIDTKGRLSVVQWGRERASVAGLVVVRQNMRLLVDHSAAQTTPQDTPSTWGWPLHDAPLVNRSALGQLPDGSLVFAYGHHVTAATMASALVQAGARTGLMLDMNVTQPGGFVYQHLAGRTVGQRVLPTVVHPPTVYLARWIKDFVVALAPA